MRMAGPDIVLFVIGALLFGGATYAIVSSPEGLGGEASALGAFTVTYSPDVVEVGSENVPNMRSGEVTFDVTTLDVSKIIVTVSCNDVASATPLPFQLAVSVSGPNGTTGEQSGSCGSPLVVELPTGFEAPTGGGLVPGDTEAEARANLASGGDARAVGTWTVTVSGSRGASPLPVGDPQGTVTLEAETVKAALTPLREK